MLFLLLFENYIVLTPSTEMNLHVQDYTYLNINNPIVSILYKHIFIRPRPFRGIFIISQRGREVKCKIQAPAIKVLL